MQLSEATAAYITSMTKKKKSRNHIEGTKTTLFQFRQLVGDQALADIDWTVEVERVGEEWIERFAASTVNVRRSHLKCFIDFCERRRYVTLTGEQVLDRAEFEEQHVSTREWIRLKPLSMLEMVSHPDLHPMDRMFIALGVNTGMRRVEIQSLEVRDVWMAEAEFRKYDSKTRKLDWSYPMNDDLLVLMREHLTWYAQRLQRQGLALEPHYRLVCGKQVGTTTGWREVGWCDNDLKPESKLCHPEVIVKRCLRGMVNPKTGRNYTDDELNREGMHTLRRSAGLAMFLFYEKQGHTRDKALKMVQVTLGHSDIRMTEKYIGLDYFKDIRNEVVKGQGFLSTMVPTEDNVTQLRPAR